MACYYFKYTPETGAPLYLEDEPIKWDQVKITLERDKDWHGVNYEYTDEDIQLQFDCLSGKDFIEQIYQEQGGDGYIGFEFGYSSLGVQTVLYAGKINLNTRKYQNYFISCSIERDGLHDVIKSRWETKADLTAAISVDGDPFTAQPIYPLELHSKTLSSSYYKKTDIEGSKIFQAFLGDQKHDIWFVFNTETETLPTGIDQTVGSQLGPTGDNPVTSELALIFDLNANGVFDFNKLNFSYLFNIKMTRKKISEKPKIGDWYLDHYVDIYGRDGVIKTHQLITPRISGYRDGQFLNSAGDYVVNFTGTPFSATLVEGDKVYLYAHFNLDGFNAGWKGLEAYIYTAGTEIDITASTNTSSSSASVLLIHEALNETLSYISGEQSKIYSNFFGRTDLGYLLDGCGSLKAITNGFQIRQFKTALNPVKVSMQDLIKSLNAIFCIGFGYELDKVRIEDRSYFYQDVEMLSIFDIGDYTEDVAKELVFNSLEVGYAKFLEVGKNSITGKDLLDQFSTQHQYTTPIRSSDNKFSQLSILIGSGEAIETTRRFQFQDTPQDSTTFDDDGFIIALKRQAPLTLSVIFGDYIEGDFSTFTVDVGDSISISGSVSNNGTKVVGLVETGRIYVVTPLIAEGPVSVQISNLTRPFTTEKNEAFGLVQNLNDPQTAYNLRHTPHRNLLNHAKWINGGLYYKEPGEVIANTFVKQNGELITQFSSGETCPLGDINLDVLQEKSGFALAQFQEKDNYFIPEWVTFKTRLPMEDIILLRDCMTGQNLSGLNYGYISVRNPDGDTVQAWIYKMVYNPNSQLVEFTTLKKKVIPRIAPDPFICSDYADYTFAQFEALPDLSTDIEECRFVNFN